MAEMCLTVNCCYIALAYLQSLALQCHPVLNGCMLDTALPAHSTLLMLQEIEDLDRQLRLMSDSHSALAAANGMRQLTITDKGRSSNKVSAHSIAKKVRLTV